MKTKKQPYDAVLNVRIDSETLTKLKSQNIDIAQLVRDYLKRLATKTA